MSEHDEQVAVVNWFDLQYPSIRGRLFAIPNGGKRNKTVAIKLKREGVRKGILDLMLPCPTLKYHGLFIEMKDSNKGTLTIEQKDWINYLNSVQYKAVVCYGFDEAIESIKNYLM